MPKDPTKAPGALGKSIASKIKAARIEAGVSQEELGKDLGVTFQQIQKYEKRVNRITPDRRQLIAQKVRQADHVFSSRPPQTAHVDTETIGRILGWMDRATPRVACSHCRA